jgi:hypothetical protein
VPGVVEAKANTSHSVEHSQADNIHV